MSRAVDQAAVWVPKVIGAVFVLAVVMKLASPGEVVGGVMHAVSPLMDIDIRTGRWAALGLIVLEAALGGALLVRDGLLIRATAAALLAAFGVVLMVRFTVAEAPSCGCLGRLSGVPAAAVPWIDSCRNMLFAAALLIVPVPVERREPEGRQRGRSCVRPGFSLVEVVVVVVVVAVVLALTLPTLGRAKHLSAITRSLALQQQFVARLSMYAQDHREAFPHFRPLGNLSGAVDIRGIPLQTNGYLWAHMAYWLSAVGPDDEGLVGMARWPRVDAVPITAEERERGVYYSVFFLTAAAAIDPSYFEEPVPTGPDVGPGVMRCVRWSEMIFPASKGLFIDFALIDEGNARHADVASFGDGSAADITRMAPPEPIIDTPATGVRWTVINTRHGIRGRDR